MSFPKLFLLLVLSLSSATAASFSTVVIDAGHGGHDRGGIPTNIIPEKNVALDVALRVKGYLANAGFRTVMTRSSDVFIPLDRRVSIANANRRSIMVSIHFNSAPRRGARGVETFYCAPSSRGLAQLLLKNVSRTTTGDNRGVKHANFHVLRNARVPAALVECGFLTNPQDAALASSKKYRDQLARAIARAIIEYRNQ